MMPLLQLEIQSFPELCPVCGSLFKGFYSILLMLVYCAGLRRPTLGAFKNRPYYRVTSLEAGWRSFLLAEIPHQSATHLTSSECTVSSGRSSYLLYMREWCLYPPSAGSSYIAGVSSVTSNCNDLWWFGLLVMICAERIWHVYSLVRSKFSWELSSFCANSGRLEC